MHAKKYIYSSVHTYGITIASFFNFLLQFFFRNGAFVYVIIVAFLSAVTFIILILNSRRLAQRHLLIQRFTIFVMDIIFMNLITCDEIRLITNAWPKMGLSLCSPVHQLSFTNNI